MLYCHSQFNIDRRSAQEKAAIPWLAEGAKLSGYPNGDRTVRGCDSGEARSAGAEGARRAGANLSGKRTEKKSLGAALFASRAGACFGWSQKICPGHVFITESGEIPPMEIEQLTELICLLTGAQEIHYTRAGCTIASHCGPKTLGVLFMVE